VLLGELTPEAVDALVCVAGADSGSPLISVQLRQLGGALGRDHEEAGALPMLEAEHAAVGVGAAFDEASRAAVEDHIDRLQAELAPYSPGGRILNFADRPGDVSAAFRPEVWERLRAVKARYDPAGLFVAAHGVG
jgi:hypothetical protein